MVKVSIACLIYKSTRWLDFVYEQIKKHTNLEGNEFYFVANDACEDVLNHLKINNIPHYIHNNSEEQKKEWYINNVYRAFNTAGRMAKGEYIVFINSDMAFSPRWLDILLESIQPDMCICSRLVERGILSSGLYGIEKNFGNVPNDYNEKDFLIFCEGIKQNLIAESGLYMPMLIKKEHMEKINYYPEGNIKTNSNIFNPIYSKINEPSISGDHVLIQKLKTIGVNHFTHFSSIVYHFQEGEKRDTN
jgi:hypothetical protein